MLGVMNAATLPPNPPTRQTSDQALVADPHATGPEDVLEALGSSEKGLTADEASARLETYGPNALPTDTQESALKRLLRQFHDPMIYVLIGAAVLTTVMGHLIDTVVIAAVVITNALIGYIRSEEHTSELQSRGHLVCRLLLETKN